MVTDTDGIILKQTRLPDDRRMLTLYTRKFGRISAGSSIRTNGKNKSALALRVFTHGRYELFKGRESYNINSAETIESYYRIGEDIEKYMLASYALEFTDRVVPEGQANEQVLDLLLDFMRLLKDRKKKPRTLLVVYRWKLLQLCGYMPELDHCVRCSAEEADAFSVADGGLICKSCRESGQVNQRLLYEVGFDIIKILKYIRDSRMSAFEKLALNDQTTALLEAILKDYVSYHLDIENLKSETYLL